METFVQIFAAVLAVVFGITVFGCLMGYFIEDEDYCGALAGGALIALIVVLLNYSAFAEPEIRIVTQVQHDTVTVVDSVFVVLADTAKAH